MFDIWDLNYEIVINKVEKMLSIWSKRKLTLPGKVTVIKSLALSKFVHLFLALPNPPDHMIKSLEKKFYKFIWNNGPDRIKRCNMIKNINDGGLNMIKIDKFIMGLKVSWLRRVFTSNENCTWGRLSKIDFSKLFVFGDGFVEKKAQDLQNPFWKDLLQDGKIL